MPTLAMVVTGAVVISVTALGCGGDGIANMSAHDLPTRIGPSGFGMLGGMVAVRCPSEYEPLMQRAGGCGSLDHVAG